MIAENLKVNESVGLRGDEKLYRIDIFKDAEHKHLDYTLTLTLDEVYELEQSKGHLMAVCKGGR